MAALRIVAVMAAFAGNPRKQLDFHFFERLAIMVVFAMLAVMVVFAILAVFAFLATLRIVAVMAVFGGNPRKQRDFFFDARFARAHFLS